ncbi:nucleotidyltransferase domain-containing protein [Thermoflexus hugenholtzii]|jgi:Nucleotidyltransferase domain.|uniref:Nucleotidyltransferase domain-containing protein n=1 Tax=Thermoflexus hugenholtzii JAD2 TaxID=877466 RepID=A0A212R5U5_9CHLR|nr:nucleotidyltransferase domain-containing protein [Thermoflexus hugenholtzii]SNB67382.1 Nucleotidyltransferase domain-containing protein [Thermoflexus hugenholtzii JAD2]
MRKGTAVKKEERLVRLEDLPDLARAAGFSSCCVVRLEAGRLIVLPVERQEQIPVQIREALQKWAAHVRRLYGARLRALYLFGSYARGEWREDSDVDVAVVLDEVEDPLEEIHRIHEATSHVALESELLISVVPISWTEFLHGIHPLSARIREEGIEITP